MQRESDRLRRMIALDNSQQIHAHIWLLQAPKGRKPFVGKSFQNQGLLVSPRED